METQIIQKDFDKNAPHPVQSFAWGEFRKTQSAVERFVEKGKSYTITFHSLPLTKKTIGVLTQSHLPNKAVIERMKILAKKNNCIFIKIEPYVYASVENDLVLKSAREKLTGLGLVRGKALYPEFSCIIDLSSSQEKLLGEMKSKTRYNVRLAEKKGVKVIIDQKDESFDDYLSLLRETTQRQTFYAHTNEYQKNMWQCLKKSKMAWVARSMDDEDVLSAWILLMFNNRLYYPYGASTRRKQNKMASSLLMWEAIKFGKENKCDEFELWGCLGPNPDNSHSWYGFHRFKTGFGGELVESVGAYDLVFQPMLYSIYQLVDRIRWWWLKRDK